MYNKKVLSKAVSNLGSAKAPAKKRDKIYTNKEALSPFVSSEGYKQGPPPAGTNYRIPGDTLYNPTPYPIEAVSDNGIRKRLKPYDTENTYFPGATHVDEYEDYYDDELTDDEIEELRRGGYVVEELPKAQTGQQIYKYADRPEAKYKKDDKGNWLINLPSTNGQFVPINDPSGKRAGELNEKATLDPSQFRRQYEPMTDVKPQVIENTAIPNAPKADPTLIDRAVQQKQAERAIVGEKIRANPLLTEDQKLEIITNPQKLDENVHLAYEKGPDEVKAYTPDKPQGFWDKAGDIASNPMTSLGFLMRGEAIPDYMQRDMDRGTFGYYANGELHTERNPLDFAVADMTGLSLVNDARSTYKGLNEGDYTQAGLGLLSFIPGFGEARKAVNAIDATADANRALNATQGLVGDAVRKTQDVRLVQNAERSEQLGADAYDVYRGNQRVGEVSGNKTSRGDFEVTDIGVDPQFQKQGIGQEIYKQLNQSLPEGNRVKSWGAFVETNGVKPGEKTWQALEREGLAVKNDKGVYEMVPVKQTSTEAGKVEQASARPAQYTDYNRKDDMYDVYNVNLATEIKPGRTLEDVQHKMKNLRKDLGIGPVEHLMNKYIPGFARPIPLDQGKGLMFDPTTGKLFDSNTRYWLNKEYGFNPQIDELLGGREKWAAKTYGTPAYSSSNGTVGLKYLDETDAYKKGGEKKYSRSLSAKNRLFVENKLTKKPKSKKKKIFDPNAKYFQDGGVQCDDDGRCYETDQAQELLDKTHQTVTNALKIDQNVLDAVSQGYPANEVWQEYGVKTADQLTGDPYAYACANSATRGYAICDPNVKDVATLSNDRMKNAVAQGTTPFRKVGTYTGNKYEDVVKPGNLVSFMSGPFKHMVKNVGPDRYAQSTGSIEDWNDTTGVNWVPGNIPATVYEYAPYYNQIQALEEQARINPTYVPGTSSVGTLPIRPAEAIATQEAERVLPAVTQDLGLRQFGGIPTLPLNQNRQVLRDWVYGQSIGMLQEDDGGYMDLDLSDEEIQRMKDLGYYVEEY
jgi:hypothetical protein